MTHRSGKSVSALSNAFNKDLYASHGAEGLCDEDLVDLDNVDDLEEHGLPIDQPMRDEFDFGAPSSTMHYGPAGQSTDNYYVDEDPLSAMLGQTDWDDFEEICGSQGNWSNPEQSVNVDLTLPHPDLAYGGANESSPWNPTQAGISHSVGDSHRAFSDQASTSPPQHATSLPIPRTKVPGLRSERASFSRNSYTAQDSPMVDYHTVYRAPSQAFSEDNPRSPPLCDLQPTLFTTPKPSSTAPTEYDGTDDVRHLDGTSEYSDAQAGVPINFMEDFDAMPSREISMARQPEFQSLQAENILSDAHRVPSFGATAHLGSHFAVPRFTFMSTPWSMETDFSPVGYLAPESNRYEPGVASSFPTTRHHYSPASAANTQSSHRMARSIPITRDQPQAFQQAASNSEMPFADMPRSVPASVSKQRVRRSTMSSSKPESIRLKAIHEGKEAVITTKGMVQEGNVASSQPLQRTSSGRPKRKGPLEESQRKAAAEKRSKQNSCMPCRRRKVTCDGAYPCDKCSEGRDPRICVPAVWYQSFLEAPCDRLYHRTLSSGMTNTNAYFTQLLIPVAINSQELVDGLYRYQSNYNIRVTPMSQSSYVINLQTCLGLLSQVNLQSFTLQQMFGQSQLAGTPSDWVNALRDFDSQMTEADRLVKWGSMPSQAVFELVPGSSQATAQTIKIYQHHRVLVYIATLNRMVLRALEYTAHKTLQARCKRLIQSSSKLHGRQVLAIEQDLGGLACSLRLQIAWSQVHEADLGAVYIHQLRATTRILYFWYLIALKKRNIFDDVTFQGGEHQLNIHGIRISDPFPGGDDESECGFEAWLSEGHTILTLARLGPQNSSVQYGFTASMNPSYKSSYN